MVNKNLLLKQGLIERVNYIAIQDQEMEFLIQRLIRV